MTRIVVLGGYGVFGSRVAERLAREADLEVVVAGRSATSAEAAAAALARSAGRAIGHAALDATTASPAALRALGASVLINASGPFQSQDYTLARACIAAGVHYVDLADARAFVTGIGALDAEARAADVLVVSGASSVPGLSAAVVDHYAPGFGTLTSVSHGISPGNSFDPGVATTASIVGAVGLPFSLRIDGREAHVYGWQGLHRHRFPGLGARWMGHCDIPDLALLPARHPSLQTVRFAAGVEVGLFHLGLWAMAWLRRAGLLANPERLAAPLLAVKRRLGFLGSDQGGMFMTLEGVGADGRAKRIDWHLEARQGHGPYIPAIAAVLLARGLARGRIATRGAMPCVGLFTLPEFLVEVADLDIRAIDSDMPLYCRLLGARFAQLPDRVRALHDVAAETRWIGHAEVLRGRSWLGRLAGWLAGLPPASRGVPLTVTFTPRDGREVWTRSFAATVFRSVQGERGFLLHEQVGPARLIMEPVLEAGALSLKLRGMRVLGLPVPRVLLPQVATREWQQDSRYHFEVEARLPVVGDLVRYAGWLEQA